MRQDTSRWRTLQLGSHAYAISERVYGAIDDRPGTVVSVDRAARTITVQWADAHALGDVIYPDDTIMIRRAFPWET